MSSLSAAAPRTEEIAVIQRRPFLKAQRLELGLTGAMSVNDLFARHLALGGELRFHFSEWVALAVEGQRFASEPNARGDRLMRLYNKAPSRRRLRWAAGGLASVTIGYAKVAVVNRIIGHWEPVISVGAGVVESEPSTIGANRTEPLRPAVYGTLAFALRLFLGRAGALSFGVRDYVFYGRSEVRPTSMARGTSSEIRFDDKLTHVVIVGAGLSLFIPWSRGYTQPR